MKLLQFKPKETAREILERALMEADDMVEVIVLAYNKDSTRNMYSDTNVDSGPTSLWMLETAKHILFKVLDR